MKNEYSMVAASPPYTVTKIPAKAGFDLWAVTFTGPVYREHTTDQWCVKFAIGTLLHLAEQTRKWFPVDSTHSWCVSFAAQNKWSVKSWTVTHSPPIEVIVTALTAFHNEIRTSSHDVQKTTAPIRISGLPPDRLKPVVYTLQELLPEYEFATYRNVIGCTIIGAYKHD